MWPYIRDVLELSMFAVIVWLDWRLLRVEENNQNALRTYLDMRNKYYSNRTKQKSQPEQRGLAKTTESGGDGKLVQLPVSGEADGERPAVREASADSGQQDVAAGDAAAYNQSIKP